MLYFFLVFLQDSFNSFYNLFLNYVVKLVIFTAYTEINNSKRDNHKT